MASVAINSPNAQKIFLPWDMTLPIKKGSKISRMKSGGRLGVSHLKNHGYFRMNFTVAEFTNLLGRCIDLFRFMPFSEYVSNKFNAKTEEHNAG